ncbi:MAG: cupredoxin domain-containing protein [Dehalococcoidia bacterium]
MADEERNKRRRGRRRGRQEAHRQPDSAPDEQAQGDVSGEEITSSADIPGVTGETPKVSDERGRSTKRERTHVAAGTPGSPMDFWRSNRARTAREQRPGTAKGGGGIIKRLTSIYLPPWVPVVGIIIVVFGILGLLFVTRSATGAPRQGSDHWHAPYTYYVCGEKQPPAPTWEFTGVHTHGDGIVHIHPFDTTEEGSGARLVKWFEYGGGKLDGDEIRMPGTSVTHKNGEECPDGTEGKVQIFVNGAKQDNYTRYIPHDGDRIRIIFGPEEDQIQLDDRIVLDEAAVTRETEVTINQPDDADETSTTFTPASISIRAGETVKIIVHNVDEVSHGLRIAGYDTDYGTNDDFVAVPEGSDPATAEQGDLLQPGMDGFVIVRFDDVGNPIEFQDPTVVTTTGTIIIQDSGASPTPVPEEEFDSEAEVKLVDSVFEPAELTINAGDKVKLTLPNTGALAHNVRIAGPDGDFETEDDIVSADVPPGQTGEMFVQIDDPGTYDFRCDFHQQTHNGTLTVE